MWSARFGRLAGVGVVVALVAPCALGTVAVPAAASALSGVSAVSAGDNQSCALLSGGTVECWGQNLGGELGDGTTTAASLPVTVLNGAGTAPLAGVIQIATGGDPCALKSNGTVRCWGGNVHGQLGIGTTSGPDVCNGQACSTLPVEVLDTAGTAPLTGVTQVAGSAEDECAVLADTSAVCWGDNSYGQAGGASSPQISLPSVVVDYPSAQPLTGIRSISVGGAHTCAALLDGTARCWGYDFWGEVGNGNHTWLAAPSAVKNSAGTAALTGVASISAGGTNTCALLDDSSVLCWGEGNFGEIGNGSTPDMQLLPTAVQSDSVAGPLTGVASIGVGGSGYACAGLSDSTVRCWGDNSALELGDGALLTPDTCASSTFCATTPVVVQNSAGNGALAGVAAISTGGSDACAVLNDATMRCWGQNAEMQLGDGTTVGRCVPAAVGVVGPEPEAPASPTGVVATAGIDEVTIQWALQTGDCGTPVTSFEVTLSPGGSHLVKSAWLSQGGNSPQWQTSLDFYPLTPGVAYTFTVTATDDAGTSGSSAPTNIVVPLGEPSAPTAVSATSGDRSATINWTAPSLTNGSPISGYAVTTFQNGVSLGPQVFDSLATTETIHSLVNGRAYSFEVAAINGYGTGTQSSTSATVTPAGPPAAPTSVKASSHGTSTSTDALTVSYAAGNNNGSVITRFTATCTSSNGGATKTGVHIGSAASPITIAGATTGKTYTCKVTAANIRGAGSPSAASPAVTVGAPGAPTAVKATKVSAGKLDVTFLAPTNNGAAITSSIAVCRSSNGGTAIAKRTPAGPIILTGLTPGRLYTCTVQSTNSRGTGPASAQSAATTA